MLNLFKKSFLKIIVLIFLGIVILVTFIYFKKNEKVNVELEGDKTNIDLSFVPSVENIEVPEFPNNVCNIVNYGAVKIDSGEENKNVDSVKKAIEDCSNKGGGMVKIPAGEWLFNGPIHLKSNINLSLDEGSVVTFSSNPMDYLPVVKTRYEGIELMNFSPMIYVADCENVAITGKGTIQKVVEPNGWDGYKKKAKKAEKKLYEMSINDTPIEERVFGTVEDAIRVSFIQPYNCKNVLVEGVTIKDGPMWTLHVLYTENLIVRNIKIQTSDSNTDGIAIDSTKNVLVENNELSTGDDAIVIKSGKDQDGWRVGKSSENIVIKNNVVTEGHGGVSIGSEMSGDVRNVLIDNLRVESAERGIRIKSRAGRGGLIENVLVRNSFIGKTKNEPIQINFFYGSDADKPYTTKEPEIKNVKFENIEITSSKKNYMEIVGLKGKTSQISFKNIKVANSEAFATIKDVDNIYFENIGNLGFKAEDSNLEILSKKCSVIMKNENSNIKNKCI